MSDTPSHQILVIAGDYEVHMRVQSALSRTGCNVRGAYSHRDALYILEHEPVDLSVIDAAMFDRLTGEYTARAAEKFTNIPQILYAREGLPANYSQPPVEMVIGALDDRTIQRSVMSVLDTDNLVRSPADSEIQTLFSLTQSLAEVLDLSEVLNRVLEAARHLTGAEVGMILLPDDEGRLYLRARVGIDDEVARNLRIKTEDTLAGQVFSTGRAVLIGAQGPQKVKTKYFVNSLLYVPILLKGTPIGVLGVNNKNSQQEFSKRHQDSLLNLA